MSMHDIKHKCGVFGIFGIDEASVLTTLGLHSLQHRGQAVSYTHLTLPTNREV